MPNPETDKEFESGAITVAGFGVTHDFFSQFEKLSDLKVPYVEILREDQVKDLLLAEKVKCEIFHTSLQLIWKLAFFNFKYKVRGPRVLTSSNTFLIHVDGMYITLVIIFGGTCLRGNLVILAC